MKIENINSLSDSSDIYSKIVSLDNDFFPQPWKEQDWHVFLQNSNYSLFVILDKTEVCGLAMFGEDRYSEQAHLLKIVIHPNYRGSSHGFNLMNEAVVHYRREKFLNCYLEVSTENLPAIKLYEKFGFKVLTKKKKFYSNGEDAFAMQLIF